MQLQQLQQLLNAIHIISKALTIGVMLPATSLETRAAGCLYRRQSVLPLNTERKKYHYGISVVNPNDHLHQTEKLLTVSMVGRIRVYAECLHLKLRQMTSAKLLKQSTLFTALLNVFMCSCLTYEDSLHLLPVKCDIKHVNVIYSGCNIRLM
jgi:hypothetical protein